MLDVDDQLISAPTSNWRSWLCSKWPCHPHLSFIALMLLLKWLIATALKAVAMPCRTLGSIVLSQNDFAAENRKGSRTLYWATAWSIGRLWVRKPMTAIGSPSFPVTNRPRLYRSATKEATFKYGITEPEMRRVPTATRWIADAKSTRLSPVPSRLPNTADLGRRTWLKYVIVWSMGWVPVLVGKTLELTVRACARRNLQDSLWDNILAHLLAISDLNKNGSDSTILAVVNEASHDNGHGGNSTSSSCWGHDSIGVLALFKLPFNRWNKLSSGHTWHHWAKEYGGRYHHQVRWLRLFEDFAHRAHDRLQ